MRALEELVMAVSADCSASIDPMAGGASSRRYFRVELSQGGTVVAVFTPSADGVADEVGKSHARTRWPFLEIRDLLENKGIRVPKLFADASARGWLLLEDLGEDTLANVLLRAPAKKSELYTQAVTDLARAQIRLESLPEGSVVSSRAFDVELLRCEIDHFREWGLDARGIALTRAQQDEFELLANSLAHRIADFPRSFTHRDYQSRNLMVDRDERLVWIDFQDALLGPRVYDLVALLNDSYQTFEPEFVAALIDEYCTVLGLGRSEFAQVHREFDLVTVQRKLKDAGRFVYIDRVKKDSSFLPFVSSTVQKALAALERVANYDADMARFDALLRPILRADLAHSSVY